MCHLSEQKLQSIYKEILTKALGEIVATYVTKIDPELEKRDIPWWSNNRKWEREDIGYVTIN